MDLGPLRSLVLSLNQAAHGVEATVTRPDPLGEPIETRVIWVTPVTEDVPSVFEASRREPVNTMALSLADVPEVPTGTLVQAPPRDGGAARFWRVTAIDRVDPDKVHVIVVEEPE